MTKSAVFYEKLGQWSIKNVLYEIQSDPENQRMMNPGKRLRQLVNRLLLKPKFAHQPTLTTVSITGRCPWNCPHCSKGQRATSQDIPFEKLAKLITQLTKLGTKNLALTGGEPFLRKDVEDIISLVAPSVWLDIYSTGFGITEDVARAIGKRKNIRVFISLNSHLAEINDRIKGEKGALDSAIKAIKTLIKFGHEPGIATVATKEIVENGVLRELLVWIKNAGIREVQIFDHKATGHDVDNNQCVLSGEGLTMVKAYHKIDDSQLPASITSFAQLECADMLGCTAGYCRAHIDASGNVCPCDFLPLSFGNIFKEDFVTIWRRMHACFNAPRSTCFVNSYHKEISKNAKGLLPLEPGKSLELCRQHPPSPPFPHIYDKLGFIPDIRTLNKYNVL